MEARLLLTCLRQGIRMHSTATANKIGSREIVGFGYNGEPSYIDALDIPMPGVRFKENTPEISALKEKEKGDWKKLSIEEKKILYRASFCSTFAELKAPTGEWKIVLGGSLLVVTVSLWIYMYCRAFVYPPLPISFDDEHQLAQLDRMIKLDMNPITGLSSKYRDSK